MIKGSKEEVTEFVILTNQRASFEECSFHVTAESNFVMSQETCEDQGSLLL